MAFPMSLGVTPNLTGLKEQHSLFPLVVLGGSLSGFLLQLYSEGVGAGVIVEGSHSHGQLSARASLPCGCWVPSVSVPTNQAKLSYLFWPRLRSPTASLLPDSIG